MPLAGYRVVDAFGYDVRAFVLKLQVRPSGRTWELQRRAVDIHILSVGAGGAVHQHGAEVCPKRRCTYMKVIRQRCEMQHAVFVCLFEGLHVSFCMHDEHLGRCLL